jgi:hypothetical protein
MDGYRIADLEVPKLALLYEKFGLSAHGMNSMNSMNSVEGRDRPEEGLFEGSETRENDSP